MPFSLSTHVHRLRTHAAKDRSGTASRRVLVMLVTCHTASAAAFSNTSTAPKPGAVRAALPDRSYPQTGSETAQSVRKTPIIPVSVAKLEGWVAATHDNAGMPFVIVDKIHAEVFVFDAAGHLQAGAPALLGLARGDRSVEGVGDEKMSAIRPQERITPAGRFLASLGRDSHGKEILWVDYKDAIALHPVVKGTPQERRAERLASLTSADNRISYGCINVPLSFYRKFISPVFANTSGIVYVLPETVSESTFIGSFQHALGSKAPVSGRP